MYYRIELEIVPAEWSPTGNALAPGWQGFFRPGETYINILEKETGDYDASGRLKQYLRDELPYPLLPPGKDGSEYQFWFTEFGYNAFEKVADLFLEALIHMPEVRDMRIQTSDMEGEEVLYEDEHQVAIQAA